VIHSINSVVLKVKLSEEANSRSFGAATQERASRGGRARLDGSCQVGLFFLVVETRVGRSFRWPWLGVAETLTVKAIPHDGTVSVDPQSSFLVLPNELPETFCGSQTCRAIVVLQRDARIGVM
jgi:hypothetical protein